MSDLPKGWTIATVKDLVGSRGLFTDGDWILSEHLRTGNDVRLIQLADVGALQFLNKSQKFISQETANDLGVTYLQAGDVLISRMAHPLARACVLPDLTQLCITAVDVSIARCDQSVSTPEFLMYLCNSHQMLEQAEAVAVGTTRKRISRKNLEAITIPLPPLNEQRRIVAKLEKLLGKVDASQQRLEHIPRILKRFRQAVLAAGCSGRLTADWREENPKASPYEIADAIKSTLENFEISPTWVSTQLGCLTTLVTSGSRGWAEYYSDSGSIFIRAQNINTDSLRLEDVAYVTLPDKTEGLRTKVEQLDILITITGANVTKSALVETNLADAYVSQHVALVRLANKRLSRFLFFWIISLEHGRRQLQEAAYGAGKPGLNLDNVRNVPVAIPPLAEQEEIIRRVEVLFKFADQLEARYQKAKAHVDKLQQSILAKAFRGELVRQDSNDEPASVLLKRIQAERAGDEASGKQKKQKPATVMVRKHSVANRTAKTPKLFD